MTQSYDKIDGVIWYDGELVRWGAANVHVLTHGLHYASCVFEGERAYGGTVFKSTEHSERLKASAKILDFEIPYSVAEIDAAKQLVVERNNRPNAYVRPVAWRGSEMMGVSAQAQHDPPRHRGMGMAELFRPGRAAQGHPPRSRRLPAPRPAHCAVPRQGRRPLHDLHDLQAPGGAQGLCGRHDARLGGQGRRVHRRQHLLHPRRQDPHADRRLLPRRHHPGDRDRSRPAAAASR